jgi:hypothetical protein
VANAFVAVLSYGYWQRQFGADPGVIGQNIDLDGQPFTIAGVAPPGFIGLEPGAPADIILPLTSFHSPLLTNPDVYWLRLLGRRKPGVSIEQVQADLQVRASRIPQLTRQIVWRRQTGWKWSPPAADSVPLAWSFRSRCAF